VIGIKSQFITFHARTHLELS